MSKRPLKFGQTLKMKWTRGICLRRTPICQVVHQKKERKHKVDPSLANARIEVVSLVFSWIFLDALDFKVQFYFSIILVALSCIKIFLYYDFGSS